MCGAGQWVRVWSGCGGRKDTEGSVGLLLVAAAGCIWSRPNRSSCGGGVAGGGCACGRAKGKARVGAIVVPVARTRAKPQPVHIRGQDNVV